jgi:hypothetical protein
VDTASEDKKQVSGRLRRLCSFVIVLSLQLLLKLFTRNVREHPEESSYRKEMLPLKGPDAKKLAKRRVTFRASFDSARVVLSVAGSQNNLEGAKAANWQGFTFALKQIILLSPTCGNLEKTTLFFTRMEDAEEAFLTPLLVARIQLFHDSLQRIASFEVPNG